MEFTWADYIILLILGLSILISVIRGFVREALSLATWITAFWAGFHFLDALRELLADYIHTPSLQYGAAFLIIFLTILIMGNIVGYLLGKMIDVTGLSGTDRVLGSIFGLGRGVLLVSIMLLLASFTPVTKDSWWRTSLLIPQFESIELWLKDMLPDSINNQFRLIKND